MHFLHSKYFTTFLFVYILWYECLSFNLLTCATSLIVPEDINHIFIGNHTFNDINEFHIKGIPKSGNFAEGGLLNANLSPTTTTDAAKKINTLTGSTETSSKNTSENLGKSFENSYINSYKNSSLQKFSSAKTLTPIKLNYTESNLFLGVPEIIHINGTSSIKPRKGVYFNKIVPRKGVENASGGDHNSDYLCVWLGENKCYSPKELNGVECECCKEGNTLGKNVKQNYSVNCENCKPVIHDFSEEKHICENVCCYHKLHKTASVSNTQDIIHKNVSLTPRTKFEKDNSSISKKIKESNLNKAFANITKSSKHKPNITKVPYEVESVTEVLSKSKQKIFIPIIVSLLLLPLIAILVFVILHKIKEIWDKRYYKRMDFLIDGMYQD